MLVVKRVFSSIDYISSSLIGFGQIMHINVTCFTINGTNKRNGSRNNSTAKKLISCGFVDISEVDTNHDLQ